MSSDRTAACQCSKAVLAATSRCPMRRISSPWTTHSASAACSPSVSSAIACTWAGAALRCSARLLCLLYILRGESSCHGVCYRADLWHVVQLLRPASRCAGCSVGGRSGGSAARGGSLWPDAQPAGHVCAASEGARVHAGRPSLLRRHGLHPCELLLLYKLHRVP